MVVISFELTNISFRILIASLLIFIYHFRRSKTLTDLNSNLSNRRGVSLLPGRLVKSRSTIFNSVEVIEQTLRLASTLLPPNVCYTIAYFSSALINIYCCIGEDISTGDFYPLCNPDYVSSCALYFINNCFIKFPWFDMKLVKLSGNRFYIPPLLCGFKILNNNINSWVHWENDSSGLILKVR